MTFQEMVNRAAPGEILAAIAEGTEWENFELLSSAKGRSGQQLIEDARQIGFRIFVVPDERLIYDDISRTVQEFGADGGGRGEVVRHYDDERR